ncbi:DUF742 domain-containing protein [Pseudonocardia asaccharolytica]|uniref:DUF742 domain-containing protein n=1 Tax=Pseudonocardia asaccharolytica DSM 44247 = NBRC 16224 TaxID=1123024 RepID=A0A511D786_9PSEU|nr:DUF742 domain-containing protein [Pseudonocardia asaccharolytica]GEL20487.1 hypothetical protein PA7_43240 [Pseudonocardia asaccharolytica DSM 44247 = NBRC 16224]
MTTGSDDERRRPPQPTLAEALGIRDQGPTDRRRLWGRRRREEADQVEPMAMDHTAPPVPPGDLPVTGPIDIYPPAHGLEETTSIASAVRPYAWTRGRTKSGFDLAIETLVSTSPMGRSQFGLLQMEHRSVAELCAEPRSVAEVAALLSLPLGVARVLLGDMAGLGVVIVHQTASSAGSAPDLALMERVLSGLRRL